MGEWCVLKNVDREWKRSAVVAAAGFPNYRNIAIALTGPVGQFSAGVTARAFVVPTLAQRTRKDGAAPTFLGTGSQNQNRTQRQRQRTGESVPHLLRVALACRRGGWR